MVWSRGHKKDWDYFAVEGGDYGWNYQSVLQIYRGIEDWHGALDPARRGKGGLLFVQPAPVPHPLAAAMLAAFAAAGVPTFDDQNGVMMEGDGGAAISNVCVRDGQRQSVFRAYVYPYMDRPNLTVLTQALVTRLAFEGKETAGVEFQREGKLHRIRATREVVLSLGAIHTPKLLMQSCIGDEAELRRAGIPLIEHLPGVGRNFQDHFMSPCVWEAREPTERRNDLAEATAMWKSDAALNTPDLQSFMVEAPYASPQAAKVAPPPNSWSLTTAVLRAASRGRLRLTGSDPIDIDANVLDDPASHRQLGAPAPLREARNPAGSARRRRIGGFHPQWHWSAIPTRLARPRWGAMPCQSWTTVSGFTASISYGSPTDRSCRALLPVIPWRHVLSSANALVRC
jgi:choline dehydrogenase